VKFWSITRKDLHLIMRDRRTLAVLVLLPLLFISILGLSAGRFMGWRSENQFIKVAVINDHPDDALIQRVVSILESNEAIKVIPIEASHPDVRAILDDQANNIVHFVGDFTGQVDKLEIGDVIDTTQGPLANGLEYLDIQILSRSVKSTTKAVVEQLTYGASLRVIFPHVAKKNRFLALQMERKNIDVVSERSKEDEARIINARQPSVFQSLVPGFTVMFVFFLVNFMARSLLHEREQGTLTRLMIAPISSTSLLIGKTVPFLLISIIQTVLLFGCGVVLYQMTLGSQPWLMIPVILSTSLAATGMGLWVATLVKTEAQVSAYGNLVVIGLAGIGGCLMPRSWLPEFMQQFSLITPHAWAVIAYEEILERSIPDWQHVMLCCLILLGFAGTFLILGCRSFRNLSPAVRST